MSSELKRVGNLQIDEDLPFQKKLWRVQQVGWAVISLALFLVLLGLAGNGGVFAKQKLENSGVGIQFERFVRRQADTELRVKLPPPVAPHLDREIWISNRYLQKVKIESIFPPPKIVEAQHNGYRFYFSGNATDESAPIVFHLQAKSWGRIRGHLQGGPMEKPVSLKQFSYF
jgi:hypothetical protein